MSSRPDVPHVLAPPPVILLGALCSGFALDHWWSLLARLPAMEFAPRVFAGGCLVLLGALIAVLSVGGFRRAGTPVPTGQPVTRLVTSGMHGMSRNPIYLGMILFHTGYGLVLGSWGELAILPLFAIVLRYGVIGREEAYLERLYGDDYTAYRRQVPRWL